MRRGSGQPIDRAGGSQYFFLGCLNAAPFVFDRAAKLTPANLQWLKYGRFDRKLYNRHLRVCDDDDELQHCASGSGCSAHEPDARSNRRPPETSNSSSVAASKRSKVIDLTLESDEEENIVSLPSPPPSSPHISPCVLPPGGKQHRKKARWATDATSFPPSRKH